MRADNREYARTRSTAEGCLSPVPLFAQRLGQVFRFQRTVALLHLYRGFAAALLSRLVSPTAAYGVVQVPGDAQIVAVFVGGDIAAPAVVLLHGEEARRLGRRTGFQATIPLPDVFRLFPARWKALSPRGSTP